MSIVRRLCRFIAFAQREPGVAAGTERLPAAELVVPLHLLWTCQLMARETADAMSVVHVIPIRSYQ
jgi:hypothetical protein